ncbi:putative ATP-dependent exoDNAse (Exonuclease V) beta subunit (Contains helicase and exonuclease domains) [Methylacidimicrobium sp. AP8]|uniref:UvrD-helicase domain-containing protein n=1 Tax=Methylacidimicrobium sp. AP8 TaxID=2730359 RepID=UPI0018C0CB50|nr:UvrD-helicase domain-containing protein [Methylacidimicrobium sp. AP8]CAB4244067.1 putative ATP-dependent exoDNAse (Exonuclease V) beta subunit (Contains helicase and exonuclease domains) [Methylacidimicrobium sp. AP8]
MRRGLPIARCCLIRASAGTGKTEALAKRIVDLLRSGVDPHRIVAVTFTRKAAAEILDRVLRKLIEQAEADAERGAADGGGRARSALASLQVFLADLPRLHLRTIDSLFQRIVRVCSMELGLPEDFEVMDEFEARELRRWLLSRMFAENGSAGERLAEAMRRLRWGDDGKSIRSAADRWIARFGDAFADEPERERWGGEALCRSLDPGPPEEDGGELWEEIGRKLRILEPARAEAWEKLRPLLLAYRGYGPEDRVIRNIVESYDPASGCCGAFYWQRKKIVPDPEAALLFGRLVRFWLRNGIEAACRRTRGLLSLLADFQARYRHALRRQGRIAFDDAPRLLRQLGARGGGMDRDDWLRVAYRLDSQWDHWLFDEFQDTSRAQWQALQLLVEEAIQSTEGTKTFFCVGDGKQSIYGWRGGDRLLLEEIASRYAGGIEVERLAVSYRSRPAVIELVNTVFGDKAALEELYGKAGASWAEGWDRHSSALEGAGGYSCYLEVGTGLEASAATGTVPEGEAEEGEEASASAVDGVLARLVREVIRPAERRLSCAVLVQTNSWARRLADRLRREKVGSIFLEGEVFPGADNQLGRLVAAALQSLAHPADTLAKGWLDASPLGDRFRREWEETGWRLLHEKGFSGVVAEILGRLPGKLDEFGQQRAGLLREMACRFDRTGSRDVERFLRFWREQPVRLSETTGSVQVMTVHKAKGLGFDVVVVTELERSLSVRADLLEVESAGGVAGRLLSPGKAVVAKIPALAAAWAKAREKELFERLCVLYVALTRARRELYVLAEAPRAGRRRSPEGAEPGAPTLRDLLRRTLRGGEVRPLWGESNVEIRFERGVRSDPERGERISREEEPGRVGPLLFPPRSVRLTPVAPSRSEEETAAGAWIAARAAAREWGSRVHERLAGVERGDEPTREALRREARAAPDGPAKQAALAVLSCIESEECRAVFLPPAGTIVWRERPFEALVSGRWISGIFDRVHLFPGSDGSPAGATLYEFKTDGEGAECGEGRLLARYREQIGLYRTALAQMISLPVDRVRAFLVWVVSRRLLEVQPEPARESEGPIPAAQRYQACQTTRRVPSAGEEAGSPRL